jgi:hypothetical protein
MLMFGKLRYVATIEVCKLLKVPVEKPFVVCTSVNIPPKLPRLLTVGCRGATSKWIAHLILQRQDRMVFEIWFLCFCLLGPRLSGIFHCSLQVFFISSPYLT